MYCLISWLLDTHTSAENLRKITKMLMWLAPENKLKIIITFFIYLWIFQIF